jgi:signal transduction histidine kinase
MMSKIIVVDDEKIIRERMKSLLELEGYTVFIAENGKEGLEIFAHEKPEIAIVDIKMPGIDGIEVLERMKRIDADCEVFIATGHGGVETAVLALRKGAFDYVTKPIEFDELTLNIKRALEKQHLRRQVKSQQAQIVQAAKLTAVGQLGAGVAHEMNQPLMAISAYMEGILLHGAVVSHGDLKEKLLKLKDQLVRLGTIVKRMHEYAGNRHAQMTFDDINRPIQDGYFLFRQQLEDRNIRSGLSLEENLPKVYMDRYQIQDIVINFIVNARDAMDERFRQDGGAELSLISKKLPGGTGVLFGVIDNGIAVKAGTEQDLFNPFFTTKAPGKGTGLGLSVSYGIVKNHNGLISFAPLSGERKIFYAVLPFEKDRVLSDDSGIGDEVRNILESL